MAGIELKVKGLDSLLKKLNNYPKQIKEEVNGAIEKNVQEITLEQKQKAPNFLGDLARNTGNNFINDRWVIFCNSKHAPFVEFGTRQKTKVPSYLTAYAQQFRGGKGGAGTFKQFVDRIEIWVKRKGIGATYSVKTRRKNRQTKDEIRSIAYRIALHIYLYGQEAQPFFFEPFFRRRPQILSDVRKAMKL